MRIDYLPWPDVSELFARKAAIVPIGATEQHGSHLPLGTDTFYIEHIAQEAGKKLKIPVVPPLPYSVSGFNFPYPTITLEPETITLVLKDVCRSLKFFGVETIFFFMGHGGENCSAIETAAYCITRDLGIRIKVMYPWHFLPDKMREKMNTDWHAGFLETSDMLYLKMDLVKDDKIKKSSTPAPMDYIVDYKSMLADKREGVFGDPTGANAEVGRRNMDAIILNISKAILKVLPPEGSGKKLQKE